MKQLLIIILFSFFWTHLASKENTPQFFWNHEIQYRHFTQDEKETFGYEGLKSSPKKQLKYAKSMMKKRRDIIALIAIQDLIVEWQQSKYVGEALYRLSVIQRYEPHLYGKNIYSWEQSYEDFKNLMNVYIAIFRQYGGYRILNPLYAEIAYERFLEAHYIQFMPEEDLRYKSYYKLTDQEKINTKKIFCNEFKTKDRWKRNIQEQNTGSKKKDWAISISLKNSFQTAKCSQVDLKEDIAKQIDRKKQTGFIVDMSKDETIKDIVDKYQISFDFFNFKVEQSIKLKSEKNNSTIKRKYEIIEISDQLVFLQESYKDFQKFCSNIDNENKKNKQLVLFGGVSIGEECNTQTKNFNENKKKYALISSTPYLYLKLNLNNNELQRTYWPLEQNRLRKKFGNTFSKNVLKYEKANHKQNAKKAIEVIFFAASVYLLFNNLADIKSLAKNSKKGGNISSGTKASSFASPKNFATRSPQQKYKILKYFGYIR